MVNPESQSVGEHRAGCVFLSPPEQGTMVLDSEDNVLRVEGETVVVGDLHGQFFDLLNIFDTCGRVRYTCRVFCVCVFCVRGSRLEWTVALAGRT